MTSLVPSLPPGPDGGTSPAHPLRSHLISSGKGGQEEEDAKHHPEQQSLHVLESGIASFGFLMPVAQYDEVLARPTKCSDNKKEV